MQAQLLMIINACLPEREGPGSSQAVPSCESLDRWPSRVARMWRRPLVEDRAWWSSGMCRRRLLEDQAL